MGYFKDLEIEKLDLEFEEEQQELGLQVLLFESNERELSHEGLASEVA